MRRHTARAIIIRDDTILVFERWRRNKQGKRLHYYSIPGGGIEGNESPEQAVVRELEEEMSVEVRPVRKLARLTTKNRVHNFFLCEIVSGQPVFNPDAPEARKLYGGNRYEVTWASLDKFNRMAHPEYRPFLKKLPELLHTPQSAVDIVAAG